MTNKLILLHRLSLKTAFLKSTISRIFLALLMCISLSMCKEHDDLVDLDKKNDLPTTQNYHDKLKKEFGKALATVLSEEKEVRILIKEEALKQFNYDYEVLYHMIKDRQMSNGKTLSDLLLERCGNKSLFQEIEKEMPLLTILIPELPEDSFSAVTWDVETQIPQVGLRVWSEHGVPIMLSTGEEYYFPFDVIPGFPVVVVKDNERVTTSSIADEFTFRAPGSPFYYRFTDPNFNNLNKRPLARIAFTMDQKIIDARNMMDPVNGWQRDHIYYGLTPSNDKGPFSLDFKEKITSFKFNYGKEAYDKISEQPGDPKYHDFSNSLSSTPPTGAAAWTDGYFEFSVNALVNSKATGQPSIAPKFPAKGYDIFDITYEKAYGNVYHPQYGWQYNQHIGWKVKSVTPREYNPPLVYLINWDLDKFAPTMIITIQEVDVAQTVTTRESSSIEFAANFGADQGLWKKIGLKFGASAKKVFSSERSVVTSLDSDDLGNTTVEFGDKVITGESTFFGSPLYITRQYSTGWVSFSVEPARVQP